MTSTGVPTDKGTRYPLDWLRAVAALSVVTFHAYQRNRSGPDSAWPFSGDAHMIMTGTDLMVDLFFVLSSFVLWLPVARAAIEGRDGRPGRVVLMRRVARLLPLYLAVVLIVWALTNPTLPGNWKDLLLHLTFTHVYSDQYVFWTNGPAWSLAVEFHFYLLIAAAIPVVRWAARRTESRAARIAVVSALPAACVAAGLTYLAWRIGVAQTPMEQYSAWFNPLAKSADFGLGMGLAVVCAAGVRLARPTRALLATASLAVLATLVMQRPLEEITSNWWHPMYAASVAVGLAAIVLHDGPWPDWMRGRPLAWIGGFSYGIYLIHEPTQRLLAHWGVLGDPQSGPGFVPDAAINIVVATALAWVSAHTIEAAGQKLQSMISNDGSSRDYYPGVGRHRDPVADQHRDPVADQHRDPVAD